MFQTLSAILNAIALGMGVLIVGIVATRYILHRREPTWPATPLKDKFLLVGKESATMLLSYGQIVASGILTNLEGLADAIGQPQIAQILEQHFDPKVVGYVLLSCGLMTMWARARSLSK